jgi:type IV secretory pathway TrbF-like protein
VESVNLPRNGDDDAPVLSPELATEIAAIAQAYQLSPELAAEIKVLSRAYDELKARDGAAETRAYQWKMMAFVLAVGLLAALIWDHLDKREVVRPMVQTVQVTEDHRLVQMGVPQDVLDYEPEDGQWYQMLTEWVQFVRWRGPDPTLARVQWAWAYLHTCGAATKLLSEYETQEHPFEPQGKTVSVKVSGWNKTLVPLSYHILWEETIQERGLQPRQKTYNAIFTVGRKQLKNPDDLAKNFLGLCITAFSLSEQPAGR